MQTYKFKPGQHQDKGIADMIALANQTGETVSTTSFGGFQVKPGDTVEGVVAALEGRDHAAYVAEATFMVADAQYVADIASRFKDDEIKQRFLHDAGAWAHTIEALMATGTPLHKAAFNEETRNLGVIGTVTAINYLSRAWVHGAALKEWFDKATQV